MTAHTSDGEALLTPAEVAALFRVDPKTVTRWAKAGKLTSIRTLGGHRRYRASEVHSLLDRFAPEPAPSAEVAPVATVPAQQGVPRHTAPAQPRTISLPPSRVDAHNS
jgi:excisionase family DNA binding protein